MEDSIWLLVSQIAINRKYWKSSTATKISYESTEMFRRHIRHIVDRSKQNRNRFFFFGFHPFFRKYLRARLIKSQLEAKKIVLDFKSAMYRFTSQLDKLDRMLGVERWWIFQRPADSESMQLHLMHFWNTIFYFKLRFDEAFSRYLHGYELTWVLMCLYKSLSYDWIFS